MATTLCPGYQQVEEFGPDEDYSGDEEVSYVTLDLGTIEPTLVPSSSTYRLIGLDTPTPFLQLSGTVFKGQHDSLLGTELLFTDEKDDVERSRRHVSHVGTTEQRIRFKEVQLRRKSADGDGDPSTKTGKEKGEEKDTGTAANSSILDRITGKVVPATRTPRKESKGGRKEKKGSGDGGTVDVGGEAEAMDVSGDGTGEAGDRMDVTED